MRKILALLTVIILTTASYAQQNTGKVSGAIQDGGQKTLESATISLLRAKDSFLVKMNIADKTGKFLFENLADGKYLISVTSVGHQKAYSNSFEINTGNAISLNTIQLVPQSKSLSEVTVVSKRPLIEQKIDRTIVNVEASITNTGSTAMEVLEKSPGISVDKDGNISLKGKQGVMVLVDGRPTQLGGTDLANLLRSMNASDLDQIEIMTNPPAKFDASGNSGVINIKTKKNKQFGYNGTVNLGYAQGFYPKYNESLNFNYRVKKVNLFTTLSTNYRKNFNHLDIQRNFRNKDTKELINHFDQQARMINEGRTYNAKVGMDYFASKNTTLGVVLSGFLNNGDFINRNRIFISDINGDIQRDTRAISSAKNKFNNFSTNLNFRQLLDTAGKELTADLDFITYDSRNNNSMVNSYFDASGNPSEIPDTLIGSLPQNIKIYSGKMDYLQPLKKDSRFEAGIKSSYVITDNTAHYDSLLNNTLVLDRGRTNYFIYEENINAAYVNYSKPFSKKFSGQFGLRLENTNAKGHSTGLRRVDFDSYVTFDTTFNRHYTQLFPTAYLQYKASEKNSFVLNYGRRIRRPDYQRLNPFINFLDRYTYQQGNPNLKPQFSHNIELSHTYKNFFTTTLNYTKTTDIIQQVIEQNEDRNETYVKQANIANQRQYGISVSANNPITKWWTSSIYVNAYNNKFDGIVNDAHVVISASSFMLNGSQQFKFSKTWSAELSGFYRTAGIEGVIIAKPFGMMSIGFGKQIMKNKGTLRVTVRDFMYTQRFRGVTKYSNIDAMFQERGDSRVVNFGFTYRFMKGKLKDAPKKRNGGSASEEQNRVGGGN